MSTCDNTANNKRIAKNTVFLYFRMLVTIVISLYTSRVFLEVLGIDDYGLYITAVSYTHLTLPTICSV